MAAHGFISYWLIPLFSSLVWLGMLLGMLLHWIIDTHRRHYPEMNPHASIAYISNIGAHKLKPLFIAGSVVTTLTLDASFVAERWLRHRGRLVPNASLGEKVLAILCIVFAVIGTVGLIILSIFDTWRHHRVHNIFLFFFIAGYIISAIFACWEYQRLGIKNREYRILRASFWIKLAFIIVEIALAIAFAVCSWTNRRNLAAIFEWIVAFIFTLYILSYVLDLLPAAHTRHPATRFEKPGASQETADDGPYPYPSDYTSPAPSLTNEPAALAGHYPSASSPSARSPLPRREYPMDSNPPNF
ncbi:hypothetical protein CDD82_5540 [Ophiocordyceps australis]|uniref:CWH43-like N-terminal domain-containing protein n=1 Tax=Ophiocordyceps australis TaxID=1399860 RepID=A0A2C5YZY1_9HYPO|nr:hypothetical protein CDD82_5540 [Ophiocordyceps australis]